LFVKRTKDSVGSTVPFTDEVTQPEKELIEAVLEESKDRVSVHPVQAPDLESATDSPLKNQSLRRRQVSLQSALASTTTSRRACRAQRAIEFRSRLPVGFRDPKELEFAGCASGHVSPAPNEVKATRSRSAPLAHATRTNV